MQGAWAYPKGRQVLAELSNDHANKPALTTTPKRVANNSKVATPQRGTPQRLNRQQAAMAALTGQSPRANTPTRQRRGNQKLMSSTYTKNKDDDADFVMVESPISFNKRKISDKQREKMKEKRDTSHIPTMYNTCDNSQSRSQYYEDTQVRERD